MASPVVSCHSGEGTEKPSSRHRDRRLSGRDTSVIDAASAEDGNHPARHLDTSRVEAVRNDAE